MRELIFWISNKSDTNKVSQSLNTARDLKFRILVEGVLYYPRSENKKADQLSVDVHLYFRICKNHILSRRGSYILYPEHFNGATEPAGRFLRNLVCSIKDSSPS